MQKVTDGRPCGYRVAAISVPLLSGMPIVLFGVFAVNVSRDSLAFHRVESLASCEARPPFSPVPPVRFEVFALQASQIGVITQNGGHESDHRRALRELFAGGASGTARASELDLGKAARAGGAQDRMGEAPASRGRGHFACAYA